jgi:hypothetical protein
VRRWVPIGAVGLCFAVACTSFGSASDDDSSSAGGDGDAGGAHADGQAELHDGDGARPSPGPDEGGPPTGDADIAPVDAGPTNLLPNGGFEELGAMLGCGGWTAQPAAVFELGVVTHDGSAACKVCLGDSAAPSFTIFSPEVMAPAGTYEGSVWILREDVSTTPATADLVVQVNQTGTINDRTGFRGPHQWEQRENDVTTAGEKRLRIAVKFDNNGSQMSPGTCVFIDDASIMNAP